jgi:hypothetical protein
MAADEPAEAEVYNLILTQLDQVGANALADQIREVVRRGAVTAAEERGIEKKSLLVRALQPKEALAVALKFLIAALQVPIMVESTKVTLGCQDIIWRADGPPLPPLTEETTREEVEPSLFPDQANATNTNESAIAPTAPTDLSHDDETASEVMISPDLDLKTLQELINSLVKLRDELNLQLPELV